MNTTAYGREVGSVHAEVGEIPLKPFIPPLAPCELDGSGREEAANIESENFGGEEKCDLGKEREKEIIKGERGQLIDREEGPESRPEIEMHRAEEPKIEGEEEEGSELDDFDVAQKAKETRIEENEEDSPSENEESSKFLGATCGADAEETSAPISKSWTASILFNSSMPFLLPCGTYRADIVLRAL